jgi:hypothetical protein
MVYRIKVTLRDTRPPIWRRFDVQPEVTLRRLHHILQIVMGWHDGHLHQFRIGDTYYGEPDPEFGFPVINERKVRLHEVLRRPKARMVYEYDFGDGWDHDVALEAIVAPQPGVRYPLVLAGKRQCPPEDVGGVHGYYRFLDVLADPKHPDHADMREWCGGEFDPDAFSVQDINLALHGR